MSTRAVGDYAGGMTIWLCHFSSIVCCFLMKRVLDIGMLSSLSHGITHSRQASPTVAHPHIKPPPRYHTLTSSLSHGITHSRQASPTVAHTHVKPLPWNYALTSSLSHGSTYSRQASPTVAHTHIKPLPR